MTQFLKIEVYDGDDDQVYVRMITEMRWEEVPDIIGAMREPEWGQQVVDALNASAAAKSLGITRTVRGFEL
jgi:hypothetical protein